MNYLYAAYAATWIIHGGYLCTLAVRYRRLKREMKDFKSIP
ncbi:MAG: CcmD family protein [Terriglobales bacterium]|jgi:CcmD family protein